MAFLGPQRLAAAAFVSVFAPGCGDDAAPVPFAGTMVYDADGGVDDEADDDAVLLDSSADLADGDSTTDTTGGVDPTTMSTAADTDDDDDVQDTGDDDDDSTSTGEPVVHVPTVMFTDVAEQAGISEVHGVMMSSPDCLIDQFGPGVGGFCISERMAGATAVGDFDDDGLPDIFYARTYGHDRLYKNMGDGTFEDVAFDVGIVSNSGTNGSVLADFDNDGDLDLYLTRIGGYQYALYINEGGTFTEQAVARGASLKSPIQHSPTSVAVGDYDLDGYLDMYVGEWKTKLGISKQPSHSRLLHNLGDAAPGYFEDVTDEAGVNVDEVWAEADAQPGTYAFSPSFADLDGDGWPELTVVSDFRCTRLFWNNGDGTFTDGTVAAGAGVDRNGMGSTFGDYDGDGDLDWYITSITQPSGLPENRFLRNNGDRTFSDLGNALGLGVGGWGWGTTFFDVDQDADLDLFAAAGYYYTSYLEDENQLWLGNGSTFSDDVAPMIGLSGLIPPEQTRGANTLDYDGDGDLDLLLVNNNSLPNLYRNDTDDAGDWLQIRAVGTVSNRDGYGAQITIVVAPGVTQYREVGSMSHYVGHSGREVHVGLGWGSDPVHEVRVYFPASGIEHVLHDVPRNERLEVVE